MLAGSPSLQLIPGLASQWSVTQSNPVSQAGAHTASAAGVDGEHFWCSTHPAALHGRATRHRPASHTRAAHVPPGQAQPTTSLVHVTQAPLSHRQAPGWLHEPAVHRSCPSQGQPRSPMQTGFWMQVPFSQANGSLHVLLP
jgi:hypothetical protein